MRMGGSKDAKVKQAGESTSIDETKQLGWGVMSVHPRQQSGGRQGYCTSEISCFFRMNTSNNQRKVHSRGTETEERKPSGYTEQGIPKLGFPEARIMLVPRAALRQRRWARVPIPICTFRSGSIKASRPERLYDKETLILPGGGISRSSGLTRC